MARLWMAGAEIDAGASTAAQNTGPDGIKSGTGTLTRDTVVFRTGVASYKFDTGVSQGPFCVNPAAAWVDGRTYYLRGYVRAPTNPGTAGNILVFEPATGDIGAALQTDGTLFLRVNGANQGSASVAITDSNWHRIELKAVATATGVWTAAELQLDGTSVATWTGSFSRGAVGVVGWGWIGATASSSTIHNWDDLALNDSTGTVNNSWVGAGSVALLKSTALSAAGTGWTNDAAGTIAAGALNNTPPQGIADTTVGSGLHQARNATSNANVNLDMTMTTYTAAGVAATDFIRAVQCWVATGAPVTTSAKAGTVGIVSNPVVANINLGTTGTSGAFWSGATAGTYGAGWKWSAGTMTESPGVTRGTAPVMRVTQVTSSIRIAMVCGMFIYVEYAPSGYFQDDEQLGGWIHDLNAVRLASTWMRRWENTVGGPWHRHRSGILVPS